jgi:hypothetical protein
MDPLSLLGGIGTWLFALWLSLWSLGAYAVAVHWGPPVPGSTRLAATLTAAWAWAAASFLGPSAVGLLGPATVTLLAVVGAAPALHRRDLVRDAAAADLDLARAALRELAGSRACRIAVVPLAVGLVRLLRGLAAPPMATDALTYHLARAGAWAQTGAIGLEPGPDLWGYAAYYPSVGDGFWALAMLPVEGDALIAPAGLLACGTAALGSYAAARRLEVGRPEAALIATALVATPACLAFATSGYVDTILLAMFVLALANLWAHEQAGVGLALVALALGAATKHTGLIPLAVVGIVAVVGGTRARRTGPVLVGSSIAATLVAGAYARGIADHHLFYPFEVDALGLAGNEESGMIHGGALPGAATEGSVGTFVARLAWPTLEPGVQHLNFGPGIALVAALAAAGLLRSGASPRRRAAAGLLVAVIGAFALTLTTRDAVAFRTFMAPAAGRLLLVPAAALFLLAALAPPRAVLPAAAVATALFGVLAAPVRVSQLEWSGMATIGVAAAAGSLALAWAIRRRRAGPAVALGSLAALALGTTVAVVRPGLRYEVWARAVDAEAFDPHPTDPRAAAAWPIWRAVDDGVPHVVAFAAGWDGLGHHWYRYPLMGSRLQNQVVWVCPTGAGPVVDYRDRARLDAALDRDAWLTALVERRVDLVVFGAPLPPEARWAAALPDRFSLVSRAGPHLLLRHVPPAPP